MSNYQQLQRLICSIVSIILSGSQVSGITPEAPAISQPTESKTCQTNHRQTNFLVIAGGGSPRNNEIALEKNVLYFQRTLQALGDNPENGAVFFANGNDGQATVRYIDNQRQQRFKIPNIPNLRGAATFDNFQAWINQNSSKANRPVFFYFTGHGIPDAMILWEDYHLSVGQFTSQLEKLPSQTPIVTMMAQCFSGSFAKFIYEGGNPNRPIALQTRCGFFATVSTRPSVGCTPEVNEADYRDYSSSFFAGLSGHSRTGEIVASADYNLDGVISYAEAHAFAKVDEKTMDRPVSTSEVWLQEQASRSDIKGLLAQPMAELMSQGRQEQQYVISSVAQIFDFDLTRSYLVNLASLPTSQKSSEVQEAYLERLAMELVNVGMEQKIRASGDTNKMKIIERLLKCEASHWQN